MCCICFWFGNVIVAIDVPKVDTERLFIPEILHWSFVLTKVYGFILCVLKIEMSAPESTSRVHSVSIKSILKTTKLPQLGFIEKNFFAVDAVIALVASGGLVVVLVGSLLPQFVLDVGGPVSFPGC